MNIEICNRLHIYGPLLRIKGFPGVSAIKNLPAMPEIEEVNVQSLSREDPLEEGMATHTSVLA